MIELIEQTINKIDDLIKEQLPGSKYQFELYDLTTKTKHFKGYDDPFHWGSVYKLFVVAEIIKMSEEGLFKMDEEIDLHKGLYTHGSGIMKFMTHINKLTYNDACKMVMAVSDNLCSDELLNIVGLERLNSLFLKAGCNSSKLVVNLDTMIKNLFLGIGTNLSANFYQSDDYFQYFKKALKVLLKDNYTSAKDVNQCFHFVLTDYLNTDGVKIIMEILQVPNQHSRISYYIPFSKYLLKGKTGTLAIGICNNENAAIINKSNQEVYGYFSLFTQDNTKRYFQSNDTFGLIGLEIAKLYEQLNSEIQ
jgi:beta-lactamase class A